MFLCLPNLVGVCLTWLSSLIGGLEHAKLQYHNIGQRIDVQDKA